MNLPAGVVPGHKMISNLDVRASDENWAHESGFPVGAYIDSVSSTSRLTREISLVMMPLILPAWASAMMRCTSERFVMYAGVVDVNVIDRIAVRRIVAPFADGPFLVDDGRFLQVRVRGDTNIGQTCSG